MDSFLAEITKFLPSLSGAPAVLPGRERSPAVAVLAINSQSALVCIYLLLFNQLTAAELLPN
jgi:hypothetical protein